MTLEDRKIVTDWLTLHLVHAKGAYTPARHVQRALLEDTGVLATITMLGHLVTAIRAQGGIYGTIYLDTTLA